jgi:hypothetical protein
MELPGSVPMILPLDKRWGFDQKEHVTTIWMRSEEADQYVTVDEMFDAEWSHHWSITQAFCGIGFDWRTFSKLVKKIGVSRFGALLELAATRSIQFARSPANKNQFSENLDMHFYQMVSWRYQEVLLFLTHEERTTNVQIEIAFVLATVCARNVDSMKVVNIYRKTGIRTYADMLENNISFDMMETFAEFGIDSHLVANMQGTI